jgi:hypothetical protein
MLLVCKIFVIKFDKFIQINNGSNIAIKLINSSILMKLMGPCPRVRSRLFVYASIVCLHIKSENEMDIVRSVLLRIYITFINILSIFIY